MKDIVILSILAFIVWLFFDNNENNTINTVGIETTPIILNLSDINSGVYPEYPTPTNNTSGMLVDQNKVLNDLGEPVFRIDSNGDIWIDVALDKNIWWSGSYKCNELKNGSKLVTTPQDFIIKIIQGCKL